ncbi:MAG: trimethylamine methyltransferase family protein [Candidatus Adiutrix sp.]|jgi:trimethylamine--corrinoid protein Co-methyltransferase|nr:trimethylamine methyltransferase family protein [Candidatus Adiutrix sp.]
MLNAKENGKLEQLHKASMEILGKSGIKFLLPRAVEILKSNGIRIESDVAYLTEEQLLYWVRKAPSEFKLYAENSEYDIVIGGDNVEPAPTFGAYQIIDYAGNARPALMEDFINFVKLYEANPTFKVNGGCCVQPSDVPAEHGIMLMYYAAYTHSNKCLITNSGSAEDLSPLFEMAKAAYGDDMEKWAAYPRITTIVNANSPLQFDPRMLETLITFCQAGQPINVDSGAMAGSSGPVTYAGNIALANAEVLAGIALTQMIRPGTPVMYGSTASGIDMKNAAVAIGAPGAAICFKYATLLAKYYNLPCRGGGALSDAKKPDLQAGFESMMIYKTCADNKMNFIIHAAGVLDGFASASYEKLIMDFEIIDFVNRVNREFEISDKTLALDVIEEVGHGGNYLANRHTPKHGRSEQFIAKLSVRGNAAPDQLEKNIQKRMAQLYAAYQKSVRDEAVLEKMRGIMLANGVAEGHIARINSL